MAGSTLAMCLCTGPYHSQTFTPGTSFTLSKSDWGISMVRQTGGTTRNGVFVTTGMSTTSKRHDVFHQLQLRAQLSPHDGNSGTRTTDTTRTSTTVCTATKKSLRSAKPRGTNSAPRQGVDNLVEELQLRNVTGHLSLHTTGM